MSLSLLNAQLTVPAGGLEDEKRLLLTVSQQEDILFFAVFPSEMSKYVLSRQLQEVMTIYARMV